MRISKLISSIVLFLICLTTVSATVESDFLDLVNEERQRVGVGVLTANTQLTQVAYAHSKDMSVNSYFSHTSPDGTSFSDRIKSTGYLYSAAGENIAYHYGQPDAQKVFTMWRNSPGHYSNMVSNLFKDSGLGVYYDGKYTYYTHDLATSRGQTIPPTQPPVTEPPQPPATPPPIIITPPPRPSTRYPPRIIQTLPQYGYTNGSITVILKEDNFTALNIHYGISRNEAKIFPIDAEDDCYAKTGRVYCNLTLDVKEFDGQRIMYWITAANNFSNVSSRPVSVQVDTTAPVLNEINYSVSRNILAFTLNVTEPNLNKISYVDLTQPSPQTSALCIQLRNGICRAQKYFATGFHHLQLTLKDKAGNTALHTISFRVD